MPLLMSKHHVTRGTSIGAAAAISSLLLTKLRQDSFGDQFPSDDCIRQYLKQPKPKSNPLIITTTLHQPSVNSS